MRASELGVWVWGAVSTLIAAVILYTIVAGSDQSVDRIESTATVLGAIVAAGVLAWSHFYQSSNTQNTNDELARIKTELSEVKALLKRGR